MPIDLKMNVLVVDDFATMRKIVKNILRQIGLESLFEADDGKAALAVMRHEDIHFVVSDWNMPKMSGLELLKEIRADPNLKETPFLMVTAEGQKDNIVEAAKAGVSNYVVKPFTMDVLHEKIKKIFP